MAERPPGFENHPIFKAMTAFVVFVKWLEAVVGIWFLRLFSPFCLGWGLWDLWHYTQGDESQERIDDAAIRVTTGAILIVVWFFMARCKGPWTINKGGKLERWPWAKEPAPAPAKPTHPKNPYTSPTAGKYS